MKVLFTSPIIEHPAAGGPQLRIENSIKALSRISDLHIVCRAPKHMIGGDAGENFYKNLCKSFSYAPSVGRLSENRYVRKLQNVFGGLTGEAARQDAKFILDLVDKLKIDVVWFGYGNISFPLISMIKEQRPSLKVVCDTDSVWSRFVLRELPYIKNPLRKTLVKKRGLTKEREEKAWVGLCDVTTAVSEVDSEYYKSIAINPEKVKIFSNVIDVASYSNPPLPPEGFKKPCMFLAGTFGHYNSPMDTAARWTLEEVLPKIRTQIPDIHFYIVGRGSDQTLGHVRSEHVTVTGKLKSVLPYLCNADVSVVPLKFESGTRFKILEAAACGIPVVSTVLGAEGLPVKNEQHVLLADDPQAFADAVVEMIRNKEKARRLSDACKAVVQQGFSVEKLETEAREILDFIVV